MATSRRTLALALVGASVAVAGLITYVAVGATTSPSDASLALHGSVPTTATMTLAIDTGGSAQITATVDVNFLDNEIAGTATVPGVFSPTTYNFVIANQHLYLGVPSLTSLVHSPWVSLPVTIPPLYPVSLEMSSVKVDLGLLGFLGTRTTSVQGPFTTYTYQRPSGSITLPSDVPLHIPHPVAITTTVTLASAGQLSAASITLSGRSLYLHATLTVTAYDVPVSITVPPARDVQPLTPALRERVLGSHAGKLNQLLTPAGIASLGQIRVN